MADGDVAWEMAWEAGNSKEVVAELFHRLEVLEEQKRMQEAVNKINTATLMAVSQGVDKIEEGFESIKTLIAEQTGENKALTNLLAEAVQQLGRERERVDSIDAKIRALAGVVQANEKSHEEESKLRDEILEGEAVGAVKIGNTCVSLSTRIDSEAEKIDKIVDVCESLSTRIEKVAEAIEKVAGGCIKQDEDIVDLRTVLDAQVTDVKGLVEAVVDNKKLAEAALGALNHVRMDVHDQRQLHKLLTEHQEVMEGGLCALRLIVGDMTNLPQGSLRWIVERLHRLVGGDADHPNWLGEGDISLQHRLRGYEYKPFPRLSGPVDTGNPEKDI